jgi:hypothetical protein
VRHYVVDSLAHGVGVGDIQLDEAEARGLQAGADLVRPGLDVSHHDPGTAGGEGTGSGTTDA